jgi:tryptophan synthase alpha chain
MNRITQLFETKKHGILSFYFTAGYPRLNDTALILQTLQAKGIDMAEIGIPFSDPMADGPVIQESSACSLRSGMTLRLLFEQLEGIRGSVHIPLVLMGYLNPVMQFGFERFCRQCAEKGIDGVIIPDLPFAEYMEHYRETAERHGIKVIMLITPETSEERIRLIDAHTGGFIYMVSSAATTGAQENFGEQQLAYFRRIGAMQLRNPLLVGFGISNRATYDAASAHSSGAIIGSRFVRLLAGEPTVEQAVDRLLDDLR